MDDIDQTMSREERDRRLCAAGSERWRIDLVQRYTDQSGKPREERRTRIIYLTARAENRWWWKVDDGAGSATLNHATREIESLTSALHDAQREVLFCNSGCAIVRVSKMKEKLT